MMKPIVRVSDIALANLGILTRYYGTETPGHTIEKLLNDAMEKLGLERDNTPPSEVSSLAFTKPKSATINGKKIKKVCWASIFRQMIMELQRKKIVGQRLIDELQIPAAIGDHKASGFRYYSDLGISYHGQSATYVWKEVNRLAKKHDIPVVVEFYWTENKKAEFPGQAGTLMTH